MNTLNSCTYPWLYSKVLLMYLLSGEKKKAKHRNETTPVVHILQEGF